MRKLMIVITAALLASTACNGSDSGGGDGTVELRLMTHDSFNVSKDVLAAFRKETAIKVKTVASGDAGAAVNQAILTKDDPLGDVFFGVDNTFLTRALDENLFVPYESERLSAVDSRFKLDARNRVTPIDYGHVCVNFDKSFFAEPARQAPQSLDDLADPTHKAQLVVENPATSSPGLAFLLATIARFGDSGWRDYWTQLRANDVAVAGGWEDAYYGQFSGGSGEGERPLVVSYASSPPAEVVFADPRPDEAPTGVVTDGCFEQIEFAGIMRGTDKVDEARQLIDFLLSVEFQEDMPLQMFVFPVVDDADLPPAFIEHAAVVDDPERMSAERIAENRDRWIEEWTQTVLR